MPQTGAMLAPRMSDAQLRRQGLQSLLSQFGVQLDFETLDRCLANFDLSQVSDLTKEREERYPDISFAEWNDRMVPLYKEVREIMHTDSYTPSENWRTSYEVSDLTNGEEVARAVVFALSQTPEGEQFLNRGLDSVLENDQMFRTLVKAIFSTFSLWEDQSMTEKTRNWLRRVTNPREGLSGALSRTILSDMSLTEQRQWINRNFDELASAAIFQAAAKEQGMDQTLIDETGSALYGGLWQYGSAIGLYMERDNEAGQWRLDTQID
jgi:hypothetical protein